ncbi:hypothetical protein TWF481_002380 [Arthrobotrys musiformis]|uniref:F-box domain-containing protein n=1 Tax=Arthrobotrys musiformis TaxID=47236 RepID=A0AAV9VT15_9PEZI
MPSEPQPTLATLSAELLYSILSYLPGEDIYNLLFVCKSIYPIAHKELGSSIGCIGRWAQGSYSRCRCKEKNSFILLRDTNNSEDPVRYDQKWESMRGLGICPNSVGNDAVRELLGELIRSRRLRPRDCVLKFNQWTDAMKVSTEPWVSLREYFDSGDCPQLSLLVSIRDYDIPKAFSFIDGHGDKVTRLSISFSLGHSSFKYNPATGINQITQILTDLPKLRRLNISLTSERDNYVSTWPLTEHSDSLEKLQLAFDNLENLHSLRINGIFFHPSFFLRVPKSVRFLELKCTTTPTWWLDFAKYPFENVEELVLFYKPDESPWRDQEDEKSRGIDIDPESHTFNLGPVSISTLKRFSGRAPLFGPADLLKNILASNKDLGRKHKFRQNWGKEVLPDIESAGIIMLDSLSESIIRHKKKYTWEHLQRNGETPEHWVSEFVSLCTESLKDDLR